MFFLFSSLLLLLYFAPNPAHAAAVQELTDADFASAVAATPNTLVLFYAPWCPYCQALHPKFEAAADSLRADGVRGVALARVDCEGGGRATCRDAGVEAYPSLRLYKRGRFAEEYGAERDAPHLEGFMRAAAGASDRSRRLVRELGAFLAARGIPVRAGRFLGEGGDGGRCFGRMELQFGAI